MLAGTEYIELSHNRFERNGSWGVLIVDQPYMGAPPPTSHCEGGTYVAPAQLCYFQAYGNEVVANSFKDNGGYGNPTTLSMATTAAGPGRAPVAVALADLNGDGLLDIITASSADNVVAVRLNVAALGG